MSSVDDLTLVTESTANRLNDRQLLDYRGHRENCLEWLLTVGKRPANAAGYAFQTVANRTYRIDVFYHCVWAQEGRYTTQLIHAHADEWPSHLAQLHKSNAHKDNCRRALQMSYNWRYHRYDADS
jgi:hypothetical protein